MRTDYHSHILPGIDDGAKDIKTSLEMIKMLQEQGVERIISTSHFYAHHEITVLNFLEKRQKAFNSIINDSPIKNILLGAEVAIEHDLSKLNDLDKLAIQGTNCILLELPYREFEPWMFEEIYNISIRYNLKVILAHVHRYVTFYNEEQLHDMLRLRTYCQVNHDALEYGKEKKFVKELIKNNFPIVFGSDCHNTSSRKPKWDVVLKKYPNELIEFSDHVLDKHIKK